MSSIDLIIFLLTFSLSPSWCLSANDFEISRHTGLNTSGPSELTVPLTPYISELLGPVPSSFRIPSTLISPQPLEFKLLFFVPEVSSYSRAAHWWFHNSLSESPSQLFVCCSPTLQPSVAPHCLYYRAVRYMAGFQVIGELPSCMELLTVKKKISLKFKFNWVSCVFIS